MTNTRSPEAPDEPNFSLQVLHTYHDSKARQDGLEDLGLGKLVQYRFDTEDVSATGIFDSLKGVADLDVRDSHRGDLLVHADGLIVERYGLGSMNDLEVMARSLARVAHRGSVFAQFAQVDRHERLEEPAVA